MGTLERIRRTSPYILAIFAIAFVGFMVLSDMNPSETFNQRVDPSEMWILKVNDQKYPYLEFEEEVTKRKKIQMQNNPEATEVDEMPIRKSLFEEVKANLIMTQEAEKAGILITDIEVMDELYEYPNESVKQLFLDSAGNFMKAAYIQTLNNIMMNPQGYFEQLVNMRKQQDPEFEKNAEAQSALAKQVSEFWQYMLEEEDRREKQKLQYHLSQMVGTVGGMVSPAYAKRQYETDNSTANVNFIHVNTRGIPDSTVEVSDKEIEEYYNEHKKYYKQDATRKIKYLTFKLKPEERDSTKLEDRIQTISKRFANVDSSKKGEVFTEIKKSNSGGQSYDYTVVSEINPEKLPYIADLKEGDVAGPVQLNDGTYFFHIDGRRKGGSDLVRASHILLKFNKDDKKYKDSLKKEINKIYKEATSENSDFAFLASMHSQDGSARNGGDLGYFGKGQMVAEFEKACFENEKGAIVGPIETQFGYHIIKVTDKDPDEIKFSEIKLSLKISDATKKALNRALRDIKNKVEKEGMDLASAAKEYNKVPAESHFFRQKDPILNSSYLTDLVFATEVGQIIPHTQTVMDDVYYLIQVVDARNAGIQPLEDIKEVLKKQIAKTKKVDMVKGKADSLYQIVSKYGSLSQYKTVDSVAVKNIPELKNNGMVQGVGQDFIFTSTAFMMELNKMSNPVKGEMGYYIMEVISKNQPQEEDKAAIAAMVNKLREAAISSTFGKWFRQVSEDAQIEDQRLKLRWPREY